MTTILGISGSLRRGSINSALLRAAADAMPQGVKLEIGEHQRHPALRRRSSRLRKGCPTPS